MRMLVLILFLCAGSLYAPLWGQENFNGCPMTGDGKNAIEKLLNPLKNKYVTGRVDSSLTLDDLLHYKANDVPSGVCASIVGYCAIVKAGSSESCNCHATDEPHQDIHIVLTPDAQHTSKRDHLIVEVTPRWKAIKKREGKDWSLKALRKTLLRHTIRVTGWVFGDRMHIQNSYADNPNSKNNWRSSIAEIHPIFDLEIIK